MPFPLPRSERKVVLSRLRGRAVRRASDDSNRVRALSFFVADLGSPRVLRFLTGSCGKSFGEHRSLDSRGRLSLREFRRAFL